MDQRLQFVLDAQSGHFTMTELCARYGVSRRIGYQWLARYAAEGKRGLADRSRAPHTCPHKIRPVLAELPCEFRRSHPDWGARTLLQVLRGRHPEIEDWPAASTAADLLARRGLVRRRRRRREHHHPGVVPIAILTDNGVPFATQAIHGLSYLNVWRMRLGVAHQRIHPGQPQENGPTSGCTGR